MAKGNLSACLAITLEHEGGMSTVKSDPGNWTGGKVGKGVLKGTKYGVAASAYPNLDIKNLTLQDVQPIYDKNYWRRVRGDDLPAGVDLAVFDYGVNSGPSRSVKDLQRVLAVAVDGVVGDAQTLPALCKADGKAVIQKLCARRMSFLQGLKIWNTFKRGWSRRVADIEARGVAMWLIAKGAAGSTAGRVLRDEAQAADKTASNQNKSAGGVGAGGVGVGGGDVAMNGDPNWMLWIFVGLLAVGAVVLFLKSRHNKERSKAYEFEAAVAGLKPAL